MGPLMKGDDGKIVGGKRVSGEKTGGKRDADESCRTQQIAHHIQYENSKESKVGD